MRRRAENSPFDVSGQACLLRFHTEFIDDKGAEGRWEESANNDRSKGGVVGMIRWIGYKPDMEEEHREY